MNEQIDQPGVTEPALVMQAILAMNTPEGTEAWILKPNYLAVLALEHLTGKGLFEYLKDHHDERMIRYPEILFACSASYRKNTRHKDMTFEQFLECLPYEAGQLEAHRKIAGELVEGSFFGETVRSHRQELLEWVIQRAAERASKEPEESTGTSTPTSPSKSSVSRKRGSGSASPTTTSASI